LGVDWEPLWEGAAAVRRLSLPTYPFARERYWTECADVANVGLNRGDHDQAAPQRSEGNRRKSFDRERVRELLDAVANDQLDVASGAAAVTGLLRPTR
jgi:acyl transferase domain-containing protein